MDKEKEMVCLKKELKCWESMFARKYGRKPIKEDIDQSSPEIRDSYKRYALLKLDKASGEEGRAMEFTRGTPSKSDGNDGVFSRELNKKPKKTPEKVCYLKKDPECNWRPKLKPLKQKVSVEEPLRGESDVVDFKDTTTMTFQIASGDEKLALPTPRKGIGVRKKRGSVGVFKNISQDTLDVCRKYMNKPSIEKEGSGSSANIQASNSHSEYERMDISTLPASSDVDTSSILSDINVASDRHISENSSNEIAGVHPILTDNVIHDGGTLDMNVRECKTNVRNVEIFCKPQSSIETSAITTLQECNVSSNINVCEQIFKHSINGDILENKGNIALLAKDVQDNDFHINKEIKGKPQFKHVNHSSDCQKNDKENQSAEVVMAKPKKKRKLKDTEFDGVEESKLKIRRKCTAGKHTTSKDEGSTETESIEDPSKVEIESSASAATVIRRKQANVSGKGGAKNK